MSIFERANEIKKEKDCYDCVHSEVKGSKVKCSYNGQDISERNHICSKFADQETTRVCEDCDYYQFGVFSRWNSNGKCTLTGKSKRDNDVACSYFCD